MYFSLQKERKKKWDDKNQEAIADGVKKLEEFDKVSNRASCFLLLSLFDDYQRSL